MSASGFHMALVGCVGAGSGALGGRPLLIRLVGQVLFYGVTALVAWQWQSLGRSRVWLVHRELAGISGWNVCSSGWQFRGFLISIQVVLDVCWDLVGREVSGVSAQPADVRVDLRDFGSW